MGTHQATREGGKCRGRQEVHSQKLARGFPSSTTDFADRALTGRLARAARRSSSSISTGCCWQKAAARALVPSAKHAPRGPAGTRRRGGVFRTRAASLARAASSIRARARRGAPSRRRRRRREEGPVRASRADPRRPVVTMTQSLAELERLCNVLYNSHDPNERAHARTSDAVQHERRLHPAMQGPPLETPPRARSIVPAPAPPETRFFQIGGLPLSRAPLSSASIARPPAISLPIPSLSPHASTDSPTPSSPLPFSLLPPGDPRCPRRARTRISSRRRL